MIQCDICGKTVRSIETAIEADWCAEHFVGDDQGGPICPECAERHCMIGRDGELELTFPEIVLSIDEDEE